MSDVLAPIRTRSAPSADAASLRRVSLALPEGAMAGLSFGDDTQPVDIVFLHAAGLNARAYQSLIAPLGERFHVLALDLRGHGLSTLPAKRFGYVSWKRHRDDVIAAIAHHVGGAVTLAGHSLGATAALLTAGRRPDLVKGLALIEPVILPGGAYALAQMRGGPLLYGATLPIARAARRRRERFATREAALAALTGRGMFKSFSPEALADYVGDGFVEAENGMVRLACTPDYEAATYAAQRHDPWRAVAAAGGAITVLRAGEGSTMGEAAARRLARMRPDARLATVEGAGHMLPFEKPSRVRAAIEAAALMAQPQRRFRDLV
jgi:pimeloyl-ACP methyl ester carboxylesterase